MASVLVVGDDAPVRGMLERTLGADGNDVRSVADGGLALAEIEREAPDLVILGLDGAGVCRRVRRRGLGVPILVLAARDTVSEVDADDYLAKPFAPGELVARVRALTRRPRESLLAFETLALDPARRIARRDGREIELTERETELLGLLIRNARLVVTREMALEKIWNGAAVANVVDRYVGYLRTKLGQPQLIQTVRGVGFSLRRPPSRE